MLFYPHCLDSEKNKATTGVNPAYLALTAWQVYIVNHAGKVQVLIKMYANLYSTLMDMTQDVSAQPACYQILQRCLP